MSAAGPVQLILLAAFAGTGALCGFIAAAVMLTNKRRARGYFILGVLTGLTAAALTHGRYRKLSAVGALVRGFVRAESTRRPGPQARLGPSSAWRRLRSHGQVIRAHTMTTIAISARR
jgi:hypothetical protein